MIRERRLVGDLSRSPCGEPMGLSRQDVRLPRGWISSYTCVDDGRDLGLGDTICAPLRLGSIITLLCALFLLASSQASHIPVESSGDGRGLTYMLVEVGLDGRFAILSFCSFDRSSF